MISAQNISKQYGSRELFLDVNFTLNPRERLGIVGRNGFGKTTLFRLITGEEACDQGSIAIPKGYRIGYLSQQFSFTQDTVLREGCQGLSEKDSGHEWKVEKVLSGLGFSENDFSRSPYEFSGGYQIRLNLAKVLVSEPNLLLLDEPTNFLDIVSIRWLERFLQAWPHEVMLISHDRNFMDRVATDIMGIHRKNVRKIHGTTHDYYEQIQKDEEVYEKQRLNEEKKRKHMEKFITKFRAKARQAGLVQSRIKELERMKKLQKLDTIRSFSFSFNAAPFPSKNVMQVQDLSFSYSGGEPYLINGFSVHVGKEDKICIVGKNGAGKSTLMKLLMQKLIPCDGIIRKHPVLKSAYFEQAATVELNDELTVEDEIASGSDNSVRESVRNICGAMMFAGDDAEKKVAILSGGEKCRVLLGKLLMMSVNLLLLDEPTHHLDMEACEAMMSAVSEFPGPAIVVTHDEHFLHSVATKLIVFKQHGIQVFSGTYAEFLEQVGWDDDTSDKTEDQVQISQKTSRESRKERAEFVMRRSKALQPFIKKIAELEKTIEAKERELAEINGQLIMASEQQDGERITALSRALHDVQTSIDEAYSTLADTTETFEREQERFKEA